MASFFNILILLLSLFSFVNCRAQLNQNINNAFQLRNLNPESLPAEWDKNIINQFQQKFISRLTIPGYMQTLIGHLQTLLEQGDGDLQFLFQDVTNEACQGHVLEWLLRFSSTNESWLLEKNKWAAHLIDSYGKIPEGILSGHVNSYGDFDECVGATATNITRLTGRDIPKDFDGLYCSTYLLTYEAAMNASQRPIEASVENPNHNTHDQNSANGTIGIQEALSVEKFLEEMLQPGIVPLLPSVGMCFPNSCSQHDIQLILVNVFDYMYAALNSTELVLPDKSQLLWPVTLTCTDRHKPEPDAPVIIVLIIISTLLVLCVGTGVVDYFLNHGVKHDKPPQRSAVYKYLMAFSIYTNTKKWLSTRKSPDDLGCLHGIRFLSTCWVVYGHTYVIFMFSPQWNSIHVRKVYEYWTNLLIINGTFSVDTFFVMSGMLVTYNILKLLEKTKGKFNVLMFYVHRIVRLTPTYAILVGIASTLTIYLGSGPGWFVVTASEENCRKHWWANLLYINNIYKTEEGCNGEAWYLANDMQFYLLSPLIVYPVWRWKLIGLGLLGIYTILSVISPALIVHFQETPPGFFITGNVDMTNIGKIYIRPWARIQTFFVGVWLGWLIHEMRSRKLRLPKWAAALGWIASTGLVLTVILAVFPWFDPHNDIPKAGALFYASLSRFSYAVSIAWIIFACVKGYGGLVNSFLSWKAFMPLGRLTFCIYLISVHIQTIFHAGLKIPIQFNGYTQLNIFFAHMVLSTMAGFLATMLFESPFMILQKLAFG